MRQAKCIRCARLLILHVVHDLEDAPPYYRAAAGADALRTLQEIAQDMLSQFIEHMRAELEGLAVIQHAEPILVAGIPATRILEVAAQREADLIVMGSHCHSGLSHLLHGSLTERVAHLTTIPLTIVKAPRAIDAEEVQEGAADGAAEESPNPSES